MAEGRGGRLGLGLGFNEGRDFGDGGNCGECGEVCFDVGVVGEAGVSCYEENIGEAVVSVREKENGVISAWILGGKLKV